MFRTVQEDTGIGRRRLRNVPSMAAFYAFQRINKENDPGTGNVGCS